MALTSCDCPIDDGLSDLTRTLFTAPLWKKTAMKFIICSKNLICVRVWYVSSSCSGSRSKQYQQKKSKK